MIFQPANFKSRAALRKFCRLFPEPVVFDNDQLSVRDELLATRPRKESEIRQHLSEYYGMISHADEQIGHVMNSLRESGSINDTVVVLASDNGLAMGWHGLMGKQNLYYAYKELIRAVNVDGMKLISWNIAGRVSTVDDQIDYLLNGEFDIICLQEVIAKTEEIISENFKDNGCSLITSSIGKHRENQGKHKYNLLIISKDQIKIESPKYKIKWREKYLRGIVDCGQSKIEVTTLHIPPGSSNGWEKIITIEESYKNLIESKNSKRIVCGDWNTPKSESLNGEITT